jgi:hypothetical protein
MVDIALITQAFGAASAAFDLFDKMADQIARFIQRRPPPSDAESETHRQEIKTEGSRLVNRQHGHVVQTITADDLRDLPADQLRHIQVLEQSMRSHYNVWARVYPQLATLDSPVQKAKVEEQLENVIRSMKGDLDGILSFLETCGLYLDDHYLHVRQLVASV